MPDTQNNNMVGMLQNTIVTLVRRGDFNLTSRQLGVFLICYLEDRDHTVRGLAAELNVLKPAITRALDRLAEFDLIRRGADPRDGRSVLVKRTAAGQAYLRTLRKSASWTEPAADMPDRANHATKGRSAPCA